MGTGTVPILIIIDIIVILLIISCISPLFYTNHQVPALRNICSLFPISYNPFYCGFGNRETDKLSYLEVGVPAHRVFIINPTGDINTDNALFRTTYDALNIDVDALFMDRHNRHAQNVEEFNSFNYWNSSALHLTMPSDSEAESPAADADVPPPAEKQNSNDSRSAMDDADDEPVDNAEEEVSPTS